MIHPFTYQLQQAFQEDQLRSTAERRPVAEAMRSVQERRRSGHVLHSVAAWLRGPGKKLPTSEALA